MRLQDARNVLSSSERQSALLKYLVLYENQEDAIRTLLYQAFTAPTVPELPTLAADLITSGIPPQTILDLCQESLDGIPGGTSPLRSIAARNRVKLLRESTDAFQVSQSYHYAKGDPYLETQWLYQNTSFKSLLEDYRQKLDEEFLARKIWTNDSVAHSLLVCRAAFEDGEVRQDLEQTLLAIRACVGYPDTFDQVIFTHETQKVTF